MDPTLIAALGHDGVTVANLADKDTLKDAGERRSWLFCAKLC